MKLPALEPRPRGRDVRVMVGVRAEPEERPDRAGERDEDADRRDPRGGAARDARAAEEDQHRAGERRDQAEPGARRSSAQLRERVDVERRSSGGGSRRRGRARRRPRTRRQPSRRARRSGPRRCPRGARTRSARGSPPFSMISSESSTISGLRRTSTPNAPMPKRNAEMPRYQTMPGPSSISSPRRRVSRRCVCAPRMTPPTAATSSTIDVISNASRWSVRNSRPIQPGEPNVAFTVGLVASRPPALSPMHDDDLDEDRAGREHRGERLPARPARPRCLVSRPDVRDHEQEHHHHRARVDEHLRGGDELRGEQQVEDRERAEVPDQRERRVERVRERDDREPRREARRSPRRPRRSRRRRRRR